MDDIQMRMALTDLKARQESGEHMPCPRCGRDAMKTGDYIGALSRQADVYVCDSCGVEEAMRNFFHESTPLNEWAIFISKPTAADGGEAGQ